MDVLTDILTASDVSSSLCFRATFTAPFAVDVPAHGKRTASTWQAPGGRGSGFPPAREAATRPPHPKGYEMEPTDFSLLDGVRRRERLYREG